MIKQNERPYDGSDTDNLSFSHFSRGRFSADRAEVDRFSAAKGRRFLNQSKEPDTHIPSSQESEDFLWNPSGPPFEVDVSVDDTGEASEDQLTEILTPQADNAARGSQRSRAEAKTILPYDKRASYLRISRRLRRLRVFPALAACLCALVVTGVVCGSQLALPGTNASSAAALLGCSVAGCTLAACGARSRSHVLLVGVVLLEVLFTLYAGGFALIGLMNVKLLKQSQTVLEQDGKLQQEQRDNALKITRSILIKEAIFSGLYFLVAVTHCYAAASANHLRAAVRPFDSRLRRKRQRARALGKLAVDPRLSLEAVDISREKSLAKDIEVQDESRGRPDVRRSQTHELLNASGVFHSNAEECKRGSPNRVNSHIAAAEVTSSQEQFSYMGSQSEST